MTRHKPKLIAICLSPSVTRYADFRDALPALDAPDHTVRLAMRWLDVRAEDRRNAARLRGLGTEAERHHRAVLLSHVAAVASAQAEGRYDAAIVFEDDARPAPWLSGAALAAVLRRLLHSGRREQPEVTRLGASPSGPCQPTCVTASWLGARPGNLGR